LSFRGERIPTATKWTRHRLFYNPAGDVINQGIAQDFAAKISAWNQRAATIQALALQLMQANKAS
jgi:hypothetical protein